MSTSLERSGGPLRLRWWRGRESSSSAAVEAMMGLGWGRRTRRRDAVEEIMSVKIFLRRRRLLRGWI